MKLNLSGSLLFFLAVFSAALQASHNRSGEILYKRIAPFGSGNFPVFTYSITVYTYTDDGPGVADRCVDTVYFGDGSSAPAQRINGSSGCGGCTQCGELIKNDPGYRVKMNIYSVIHTYPGAGTFVVSMSDANRTPGSSNIPNSGQVPFVIQSLIVISNTGGNNSSPVLTNPPVYLARTQSCYNFNACAFDPDDDSLSYEIVPCVAPAYVNPPLSANGTFSIDAVTGLLSWCNPPLNGTYNIAIRIKEWRKEGCYATNQLKGYVTRDMEIIVLNSPGVSFSTQTVNNTDFCTTAGNTFNLSLTTSVSATAGFSVDLYGYSRFAANVIPATLATLTGASTLSTTCSWQTSCSNMQRKPHNFYLVYKTPYETFYRQFKLRVFSSAPVISQVMSGGNNVTIVWNKVANCNSEILGYNVYRRAGTNTWLPTTCETGAPPASGFVFIGFVNKTDSIYIDSSDLSQAPGGIVNYFVTTLTNDCDESYRSTVRTFTVGIPKIKPGEDFRIFPNPFTDVVEITTGENYRATMDIYVFSVDGKMLLQTTGQTGGRVIKLELEHLPPGVYFLHIKTANGLISKKMIRQ